MNDKIRIADLPNFDMAEQLKSEEDIAEYISMVLEDGDMAELTRALGTVARARGMTDIARQSGLTREGLYKALRPNATPGFDTIMRVLKALGITLHAKPSRHDHDGHHTPA